MPVTRRELLRAAVMIPAGAITAALAIRAVEAVQATAAQLRPEGDGTSATRCGACGAGGHTMLDARCPAARKVI